MLTIEQINAMPPAKRLELFESLAIQVSGEKSWLSKTSRRLGVTMQSLRNWRSDPEKIPAIALMLLAEWGGYSEPVRNISREFAGVAADLESLTKRMAIISGEFSRLADALADDDAYAKLVSDER